MTITTMPATGLKFGTASIGGLHLYATGYTDAGVIEKLLRLYAYYQYNL